MRTHVVPLGVRLAAGDVVVSRLFEPTVDSSVDEGSVERVANATVFTISFNGETMPVSYDGAEATGRPDAPTQ